MIAINGWSRASVVVGLSLVAATAGAQQTGTIRGTITTAESRTPIAGARVATASPERIAITDDRGTYVLRDVTAGQRMVHVSAIGRKQDSSSVGVQPGAS